MTKIVLNVNGMSCSHCENRVVEALKKNEAVKKAKASAKKNTVEIKYNEEMASKEELEKIITEEGYEVI
ncbi:heavy-metal-associated domain-containing protein [Anaerofustis stercorihominis]|uniref:heavy-metal-associated domain-containing protein n=1 Tax=Anaerofustis stercorihominis TaxID=214853 RepID=UPI00214B8E41|nr:cation transporter [Anaerofustis stercorihominis]MCR2032734.1 cation transporter [Anaerofustis stercorihominis]